MKVTPEGYGFGGVCAAQQHANFSQLSPLWGECAKQERANVLGFSNVISLHCRFLLLFNQGLAAKPYNIRKFPTVSLEFERDPRKAASNAKKHRVTFEEASTVFEDFHSVTAPDPDHSVREDRYVIVGKSQRGRLLAVSFMERSDRLRIISARTLTPREPKQYEEVET